ncbi:hypothetical protein TOREUM_20240 [Tenacibaculum litoreum]|uniref:hypothetical protein n=1 Tax=Tenacibaculum litoreum TaxID=321269 RepID=UPI00389522B3
MKNILKALSVSLLLSFYCCKTSKNVLVNDELFSIKRLKSNKSTTLTLEAYDYNSKEKIGGFAEINNVYVNFKYENNDFSPIALDVKAENEFDISFHFVGSKSNRIKKVKVVKKDSIIIKTYLKNDDIID